MYTTFVYGLVVRSDLPLLNPIPDPGVVDVVVRLGVLAPVEVEAAQGNLILLQLPLGLRLGIRDGKEVILDVPSGFDPDVLRAYVLGTAMAFILRQRGLLVLHASCVALGDRAIAFLGGSGWGKSTLAAAFHQQGYRLITDDVMAVQLTDSVPKVIPSFPEVKLLPDAAALVGTLSDAPLLHSLSHKQIQRLERRFSSEAVSLAHLYVLRAGEVIQIRPLPRPQAFTELVQHTRAARVLQDQQVLVQHFHQCSHLAKAIPMAYLQRPRSLAQVPQLIPLIEDHLARLDLRTTVGAGA